MLARSATAALSFAALTHSEHIAAHDAMTCTLHISNASHHELSARGRGMAIGMRMQQGAFTTPVFAGDVAAT